MYTSNRVPTKKHGKERKETKAKDSKKITVERKQARQLKMSWVVYEKGEL